MGYFREGKEIYGNKIITVIEIEGKKKIEKWEKVKLKFFRMVFLVFGDDDYIF